MKNTFVAGLREGSRVDDAFLIVSKSLRTTRTGAPFVRMELRDRTGTVAAVKWDAGEDFYAKVPEEEVAQISGFVQKHDGNMQIIVDRVGRAPSDVDPSDFLPRCERDTGEMLAEMRSTIGTVTHPKLRALLDHFFGDEEFVARFSSAPAAMRIHHAYIGGLIEHTLSAARFCDFAAGQYPEIDRDLLITGALLHDIGKIEEFRWDGVIRQTDEGRLIGHIVGGEKMVSDAMDAVGGFDPLLRTVVCHLILSHHGEPEFGAARMPMCLEAFVLHHLENLDAKVNIVVDATKQGTQNGTGLWTEKHFLFNRSLFRGMPAEGGPVAEPASLEELAGEGYDPFS